MRKIFSLLLILFVTFGIMIQNADAKRFGGGRSFGMQRTTNSSNSFSRAQPMSAPLQGATGNKWLGPLAGFAAGGLLASLFAGHGMGGMGGGILSWLLIAGVAFFAWGLIRNKLQGATQPQYNRYVENNNSNANTYSQPSNVHAFSPSSNNTINYPAGFDSVAFLRDAKVQFIRLQAAFDSKNLNDLHTFTTPEVFGEIQLQIQERGNETNYTEVVTLNAELLDAVNEAQAIVTSVRFTGMIKEDVNAPATSFNETWHFRKDVNAGSWMVAGVQQ